MSVNLSIKNAPDELVAALKLRAKQNHRSLQGELMAIIEEAAAGVAMKSTAELSLQEAAAVDWRPRHREAGMQRQEDIDRIVGLMREGLHLGGRRFTREEMHER